MRDRGRSASGCQLVLEPLDLVRLTDIGATPALLDAVPDRTVRTISGRPLEPYRPVRILTDPNGRRDRLTGGPGTHDLAGMAARIRRAQRFRHTVGRLTYAIRVPRRGSRIRPIDGRSSRDAGTIPGRRIRYRNCPDAGIPHDRGRHSASASMTNRLGALPMNVKG
jgi:hypothetical protein